MGYKLSKSPVFGPPCIMFANFRDARAPRGRTDGRTDVLPENIMPPLYLTAWRSRENYTEQKFM